MASLYTFGAGKKSGALAAASQFATTKTGCTKVQFDGFLRDSGVFLAK